MLKISLYLIFFTVLTSAKAIPNVLPDDNFSVNEIHGFVNNSLEDYDDYCFKEGDFPFQNVQRAPSLFRIVYSYRQNIFQLTYKEGIYEQIQKSKRFSNLLFYREQCSIKENNGFFLYVLQKLRL